MSPRFLRPGPLLARLPWLTLALAALAVIVHANPALTEALEFTRAEFEAGQFWRILTGHLTHFGRDHLLWDLAALLLLGALGEARDRRLFIRVLAVAAVAIGLAVWLWQTRFASYRGLSGLDSALFGLVCARQVLDGIRARHAFSTWVGGLALLGFVLKCAFELLAAETVFAHSTHDLPYEPVPLAHLVGLVIGMAGGFLARRPSSRH